MKLRVSS